MSKAATTASPRTSTTIPNILRGCETWSSSSSSDRSCSGDERSSRSGRWLSMVHGRRFSAHSKKPTLKNVSSAERKSTDESQSSPVHIDGEADFWKRKLVLSLDGAGMQGISELFILQEVMREIKSLEEQDQTLSSVNPPRNDDESISEAAETASDEEFIPCHYFDYICGTGMGGINAVLLGRLRYSVPEAIATYRKIWDAMARQIEQGEFRLKANFVRRSRTEGMDAALDAILRNRKNEREQKEQETLLEDASSLFKMDANLCKTLVLTLEYDKANHAKRPYLFRSYNFTAGEEASSLNRNVQDMLENVTIKDVCLATSASPEFFKSHIVGNTKFRDGSEWMLNPAMELYREIGSLHSDVDNPLYCFASIGCGWQEMTVRPFSPGGFLRRRSSYYREQIRVDEVLSSRRNEGHSFQYIRLEGPTGLSEIRPSDLKSKKTIAKIQQSVTNYCEVQRENIKQLAKTLVHYRRQRALTARWEKFVHVDIPRKKTSRHTCKMCFEADSTDRAENIERDEFIAHIRRKHPEKDSRFFEDYRKMLQESEV